MSGRRAAWRGGVLAACLVTPLALQAQVIGQPGVNKPLTGAVAGQMGAASGIAQRLNDYPTAARADYVFACMATNGRSREMLMRCACSIDEIAAILPYADYERAETVLSMRQVGGERMAIFRSAASADDQVAELRRAQAEAELICFGG